MSCRAIARIAAIAATVLLAGCVTDGTVPPPKGKLPAMPADIQRCFNESVGNVPDRDLTIAEVESIWKHDRLRAVIMQRCGKRVIAWYSQLRGRWQ